MDTGERLAAYLAGDLDADEARRLEGELARDPSLRARLAQTRRLEEALGDLPEVAVPAAFSQRLRDAVQRELDERPVHRDQLAERRQRRAGGLPGWLPALAGAAAALVAVVAVGAVLTGGMGGSDSDTGDEAAGEMADTAMDTGRAQDDGAAESLAAPIEGPAVVDVSASYDADTLEGLVDLEPVRRVVDRGLVDEAASETADRYAAALTTRPQGARATDGGGEAATEAAPEEGADDGRATADLQRTGDVSEEDLETIRGCLAPLLSDDEPLIPVYAELATFDGRDAIVYGLVAHDPETDAFTRVQVWVVDRSDCEVLYFAQPE